jgi:class 3 adenylate cyclase/tetratricopeptide (TPR) repeat protein
MSQQTRRERKVVTVLFADLVGFTSRAEALDPEDVEAILRPYHERLRSELERHGGTVEKFIGDAVVALFGVPAAHEDDPERAVRAALAVQDAISVLNESHPDLALQVRIGIGTGEALVALEARPVEGDHTASGDVMNTAARLQQAAPTGGVFVSEPTYRATRDAIEYGEAEAVEAKGKAEPVRAWPAVAPRSPLGVDVVQRGPSELVGRESELRLLRDALDRARRERSPQLVTLVGVPGIGKSRLTFELLSSLGQDDVVWRQGRCLPYGDGVTFWALGEIVKSHVGIFESDAAEETAAKLNSALGDLLVDEQERAWVGEHVRPLVGLGSAAEPATDRQLEDFAAWRRLVEAIAEQTPLVFVIEDLHWADEQLLDFVDHLVDWVHDVPLMVLCTARPELLERRVGWGGGKSNAATISLAPLSDEETARLLSTLLTRSLFSAERQEELLTRAGGNPLYAEQYARMLAERVPDETLPLPETVHGIIAARLDALEPPQKELLQNAAVVGKVFWTGSLAAMHGDDRFRLEELLHGLGRKEFVRRQRRSSVAGESEHAFRHVLVREVAYSQIPRAARADKHRRAAEWIESLAKDRDDQVEMLAHHYGTALDLARAAGQQTDELEERTRDALAEAAARTFALRSYAATRNFAAAALELEPVDLGDRAQLLYLRALAEARLNDTNEEHLAEARDALLTAGHPVMAATVSVFLVDHLRSAGRQWGYELEQALAMVETAAPSSEKGWVLARAAWNEEFARDHPRALDLARKALEVGDAIEDEEVRAHALDAIASVKWALGQDGDRELEQSVAAAEKAQSPQLMMNALGNSAIFLIERGELREATRFMERAGTVARTYGNKWGVAWTGLWPVELAYLEGRWEEAIQGLERYLRGDYSEFGFAGLVLNARSIFVRLRLGRAELPAALTASEEFLTDVRKAGERRMLPDALGLRARVLAEVGREQEAARLVEECAQDLEKQGSASTGSPPWWLLDLVATSTRVPQPSAMERIFVRTPVSTPWLDACAACADEEFARAAEIYSRIGARSEEALARLWAAERLNADGRRADAEAELGPALEFFTRAGARLYVRQAEALLAA